MVPLSALWMPILLSAVIVFVTSSIIHMASPWHKNDYPRLQNEDAVRDALRPMAIPPGDYMMPRPRSASELNTPEFRAKVAEGPHVIMTVLPNAMTPMSRNLSLWFVYLVIVAVFAAYVASRALPAGTDYLQVFRFIGVSAFLALVVALWQMSIWYARSWRATFTTTIDGLIYSLLMAGTFGWLWPK